jgi:hypothetical protein
MGLYFQTDDGASFMRVLVAVLLLCSALDAFASDPSETRNPRETVTIDFLYEACSVVGETAHGTIPYFDCESYVYGVLDSYLALRDSMPQARRACFPRDIAPWRVLEDARPYVFEARHAETAAVAIMDALRQKYPCDR